MSEKRAHNPTFLVEIEPGIFSPIDESSEVDPIGNLEFTVDFTEQWYPLCCNCKSNPINFQQFLPRLCFWCYQNLTYKLHGKGDSNV